MPNASALENPATPEPYHPQWFDNREFQTSNNQPPTVATADAVYVDTNFQVTCAALYTSIILDLLVTAYTDVVYSDDMTIYLLAFCWEKGFVKLEIKLGRIETKLDSLEDIKVEMSKIEEMMQHNHDASRANKNERGGTSYKGQFLREKMPHLSIPCANLRIVEEVGSGGFGTVYGGFWQGTEVAYKEIMIDAGDKRGTERQ
eukprot:gene7114-8487_t